MNRKSQALSVIAAIALIAGGQFAYSKNAKKSLGPIDIRVAAYNIGWYSENSNPKRNENLKSVISNLKAEVIALEEIQSRAALSQIFDNNWQIGIADEESEDQEVAIAVKKPNKLISSELIFKGEKFDYAFPGKRDLLRSVVELPNGTQLVFYTVHMKSRSGGRLQTDAQREMGAGLIAGYIAGQKDENSIVLGDFNDSPSDRSLSIFETGNLKAEAGHDGRKGPFLANLFEDLNDKDAVSFDLYSYYTDEDLEPYIKGAKADNDRLRGKEFRFPQDVKVPQILFDQILVSPRLAIGAKAGVYAKADALRGDPGKQTRNAEGRAVYRYKGSLASDHLPVYADLTVN